MDRRKFLRGSALLSGALALNPLDLLGNSHSENFTLKVKKAKKDKAKKAKAKVKAKKAKNKKAKKAKKSKSKKKNKK